MCHVSVVSREEEQPCDLREDLFSPLGLTSVLTALIIPFLLGPVTALIVILARQQLLSH